MMSLYQYADPVLDMLDIHKVVTHRLFRESCYNHKGTYVKVKMNDMKREKDIDIEMMYDPGSLSTWT